MDVWTYILPEFFFPALVLGILYCMFSKPEPVVVHKHPTPFNSGEVTYKDRASNCYTYDAATVECPADPKSTTEYKFVNE